MDIIVRDLSTVLAASSLSFALENRGSAKGLISSFFFFFHGRMNRSEIYREEILLQVDPPFPLAVLRLHSVPMAQSLSTCNLLKSNK